LPTAATLRHYNAPAAEKTLFSALLWVETSPSLTSQQSFSFFLHWRQASLISQNSKVFNR
jgi:hypothetical protein